MKGGPMPREEKDIDDKVKKVVVARLHQRALARQDRLHRFCTEYVEGKARTEKICQDYMRQLKEEAGEV